MNMEKSDQGKKEQVEKHQELKQQESYCDPSDFPGLDVYAVVGNPIAHSRSPEIHHLFAKQANQKIHYGKIFSPIDAFPNVVSTFFAKGGKGLNVTVPFKLQAFEMATLLSARAQAAGAVNILLQKDGQLYGDNSDGVGLVRDLKSSSLELSGKKILLLGAGGAAQGVILPLLQEKPAAVVLGNRTISKAENLLAQFVNEAMSNQVELRVARLESIEQEGSFDLVINATASGLESSSPLQDEQLARLVKPSTVAYDMLYGKPTPFLNQFRLAGAQTLDGLGMLVEQAAEAFEVWRGADVKGKLNTREVLKILRTS
jgi:shikimate dehydrogenase